MELLLLGVVGEREMQLGVEDGAACGHPIIELSATLGFILRVWVKEAG